MKSILVVLNNNSGRKKASSDIRLIYRKLTNAQLKFKFVFISVLPFFKNLDKYDTIIVVGGDGSINSILPYVVNTDKRLGIIPSGTANLLAANLSIPSNTSRALDVILNSKSTFIDGGRCSGPCLSSSTSMKGDKYFVLRLGFGYDADILKTPQWLKKKVGYLAYLLQGFIKAFSLKNSDYTVELDNKKISVNAATVIVANAGNMFKNLFTIAPKGALDDGKLDVFFIRHTKNILDFILVFLQIIFNNHIHSSKVVYAQASNISVETYNKYLHVDGESYTNRDNLNIQVIPKAIKVFVP